ncbi:MAG: serine/threonine protein kinase [Chloroflexi bacterium]|nr:serine/threonine protein kinase [Chloroflexota bacterium]
MSQAHVGTMHYQAGETVNQRYEILESLGHGGMSDAYKARDRETGGLVVLKIPYSSLIGDPATYSRYQREVEIGKRLHHPNIQHLVEEGRLDDSGGVAPYLVLEFVDGITLREYLEQHAPLPVDEAIHIALQVADALQYCHEHGVVHRDLKPENLLVEADGTVKLVDFGIALLQGARRLTFRRLSSEVGTPDYMAPEQVQGDRGDARTDVYALGVMLYEMLTGDVPYHGDSALAVMSQHVTTDAPLLRTRRSDLPPALEAVVWRALRREPADRYTSMAALRHDLAKLDEVQIPEYPTTTQGRVRVAREHLVTAAVIVGVFALLVIIGVLAQLAHTAKGPS